MKNLISTPYSKMVIRLRLRYSTYLSILVTSLQLPHHNPVIVLITNTKHDSRIRSLSSIPTLTNFTRICFAMRL